MRLRSHGPVSLGRKELFEKASSKILKEISEKNEVKSLQSKRLIDSHFFWCALALARIYLAIVQTGYLHPDEFFQSIQVMAYDLLQIEGRKPWEYLDSNPIRSIVFGGLVSLPYAVLNIFSPFAWTTFGIELLSPKILLIAPRLFMTALSFICDFCVFRIASLCYVRPWQCVEVFAGSYIMLVYATRTFSNSIELIIFSLLLWRISLSMVESTKLIRRENVLQDLYESAESVVEKVKIVRFKKNLGSHNFADAFLISVLVTVGCFVRPSFFVFSLVPLAYWLQRGVVTKELNFAMFNWRCLSLLPGFFISFLLCTLADSFYYKSMNLKTLLNGNVSAASFTVTPFNYVLYNLNSKNLANHGIHPHFLHILVNIPLLYGVLGLVGLWSVSKYFSNLIFRRLAAKPKIYSMATMLLCSFFVPIIALSFIPHQEPRFLLPSLVPLVLLHSDKISIYALPKFQLSKHLLFVLWQVGNIACVVIFGFLHQGGVIRSIEFVRDHVASQPSSSSPVHVFFSHVYSPPTFLLMRKKIPVIQENEYGHRFRIERDVIVHDLGSSVSANGVLQAMLEIRNANLTSPSADVLLCTSGSVSVALKKATPRNYELERIKRIPGHFSMEIFPDIFTRKETQEQCDHSCQIARGVKQFSVDVFLLKDRHKESMITADSHVSEEKKHIEL